MCDKTLEMIKMRLHAWAEWSMRGCFYGLGYPTCSPSLLMGSRERRYKPPSVPVNVEAEEIETWVCEMAQQNPQMSHVLRIYYLYPASLRVQALRFKLSHTHIQRLVRQAHHWLAGRWNLEYNYEEKS